MIRDGNIAYLVVIEFVYWKFSSTREIAVFSTACSIRVPIPVEVVLLSLT